MSASATMSATPTTVTAGQETILSIAVSNVGSGVVSVREIQFQEGSGRILRGALRDVYIPIAVSGSLTVKFGWTPRDDNGSIQAYVVTDEGQVITVNVEVTVV